MKKKLLVVLTLLLSVTAVACGSSDITHADSSNLSVEEMQELIDELQEENERLEKEIAELKGNEEQQMETSGPENWADDYIIAFTDAHFAEIIQEHTGKSQDITYGDVKGIINLELNWCEDISSLKYFTSLESLTISHCSSGEWTVLGNLTNLQTLEIYSADSLTDISMFTSLTNLQTLIIDCGATDISPLGELNNLQSLTISGENLISLIGLEQLDNLTTLKIESCDALTDISAIGEMDNLAELDIEKCDSIISLSALDSSMSLEKIHISHCDNLEEITEDIFRIPSLKKITVSNCEKLTDEKVTVEYIGDGIWENQDGEREYIPR